MTKTIPARKVKAGDVLADGAQVERVQLVEGKRSTSRGVNPTTGKSFRSGYPMEADVVRVFVAGSDIPRRFWPRTKVEVRVPEPDAAGLVV